MVSRRVSAVTSGFVPPQESQAILANFRRSGVNKAYFPFLRGRDALVKTSSCALPVIVVSDRSFDNTSCSFNVTVGSSEVSNADIGSTRYGNAGRRPAGGETAA